MRAHINDEDFLALFFMSSGHALFFVTHKIFAGLLGLFYTVLDLFA
jgi:hypothetical protein